MNSIICLWNNELNKQSLNPKIKEMFSLLKSQNHSSFHDKQTVLLTYKQANQQAFCIQIKNKTYSIVYDGEIDNKNELKKDLLLLGYHFHTQSDEEVILNAYDAYKEKCLHLLEGSFAFVIDDGNQLFIARDIMGIKPLYYAFINNNLFVSSEIKCILAYLKEAIVDKKGILELLALGPSCSPGQTIYKDIYSLRPAHYMIYNGQLSSHRYWFLKEKENNDTIEETISKVKSFVISSIEKQIQNPFSIMLSGGLDSSLITSIAHQFKQDFSTYSIHYQNQKEYFKPYDYQTTMDDHYIQEMTNQYQTSHHKIELNQEELISALKESLIARDMPGMADIDSSFYLFTKQISKENKICLSGECADEIFGGYPWFYKEELYHQPYFPWMRNIDDKIKLFHSDFKDYHFKDYIIEQYQKTIKETKTNDFKKQMMYLNKEWFMQTLLTRCYTQTKENGLIIRVPFANVKLFEYIYNIPYTTMFYNNEEKGILRKAFEDFLPQDIAHRKKNPYPKTHHPHFTSLIKQKLQEELKDENNILFQLFDKKALLHFIEKEALELKTPWFGQLMSGPQILAYLYQISLWGKIYKIKLIKND